MDAHERQELQEMQEAFTLRPRAQLYDSYQAWQNDLRSSDRQVTIGRFVAFFVKYPDKVPAAKRHKFWVGKVTNVSDTEVTVRYYHTGSPNALGRATFKPWTGRGKTIKVGRDAVIDVFDTLTDTGILPAKNRRYILQKCKERAREERGVELSDDSSVGGDQGEGGTDYDVSDLSEGGESEGGDRGGRRKETKSNKTTKRNTKNRKTNKTQKAKKKGRQARSTSQKQGKAQKRGRGRPRKDQTAKKTKRRRAR